jgi:hypothetical protein
MYIDCICILGYTLWNAEPKSYKVRNICYKSHWGICGCVCISKFINFPMALWTMLLREILVNLISRKVSGRVIGKRLSCTMWGYLVFIGILCFDTVSKTLKKIPFLMTLTNFVCCQSWPQIPGLQWFCLSLSGIAGIMDMHHHTYLTLFLVLGIKCRVSYMLKHLLYHWATLQPRF